MKLTEALEMAIGALAVRRHQTLSLAGNPRNGWRGWRLIQVSAAPPADPLPSAGEGW